MTDPENSKLKEYDFDHVCYFCRSPFCGKPIKDYQTDSLIKVFCTIDCLDDYRQESYGPEY